MITKKQQPENDIANRLPVFETGDLKKQTLDHSVGNGLLSWFNLHFKTILLIIISVQVLKGTAVYQHPYARTHYLWNYDKGFIKRGFIGSFAMYLADGSEYRMLGIINFLSYLGYFAFLLVIFRFIIKYSNTASKKIISILFASSPLILGMGTLLGYYDSLLIIILLVSFQVCNGQKISPASYFTLISIGLLIHELTVIFVVIPLLFHLWIHPHITPGKKFLLIGVSCLLCLLYLGLTFSHNSPFNQILVYRLDQYAHVLSTKSGETAFIKYGDYAVKNNFLHDFDIRRPVLLEAYFPVYGFFIFIVSIIGTLQLLQLKRFMAAVLFLSVCYIPFVIILVAWDIERFICLTCCTAYVCYLSVARLDKRISRQVFKPGIYMGMLMISLMSLFTYYPMGEFYSESETLISKNKQKVLLQYPRTYIQRWFGNKP